METSLDGKLEHKKAQTIYLRSILLFCACVCTQVCMCIYLGDPRRLEEGVASPEARGKDDFELAGVGAKN